MIHSVCSHLSNFPLYNRQLAESLTAHGITTNLYGWTFSWSCLISVICHHFMIFEVSSAYLRVSQRIFRDRNFYDLCLHILMKLFNHRNLGAIYGSNSGHWLLSHYYLTNWCDILYHWYYNYTVTWWQYLNKKPENLGLPMLSKDTIVLQYHDNIITWRIPQYY